jgi:hypothetical protein
MRFSQWERRERAWLAAQFFFAVVTVLATIVLTII